LASSKKFQPSRLLSGLHSTRFPQNLKSRKRFGSYSPVVKVLPTGVEQDSKICSKQEDYPNTKIIEWEDMYEIGRNSKKAKPEGPTPEKMSMIMYTSGTSGKPKGVMIQQKGPVQFFEV